ncbi:class I SAM-dependent methyltransferase [Sorangium sp. So ce385]|uniref:class I SAM-dependent methyltransferase n=1 Tax=Sorangium sp. So ce385 TaxID=3133308 RepID=UPI003F5B40BA
MVAPSLERHLLNHSLAMALLSWNLHVFQPALALRRLGLYRPATLGERPEAGAPRGGGPELSLRHAQPVLLPGEPEGYESVRAFDDVAHLYEAVVRPFSDPIVDETVALMRPYLAPSARILDPSAGTGQAAIRLSRLVPEGEVVAADLSRGMLEQAHEGARRAGCGNMAFFQADVARPPAAFAGYFDAIVCCLSFHHYPDGAAAARAFRGALAPGGKAFVADAGPAWFVELARPISMLADPGFVRHRTGEEFQRLFLEAGFSSVFWIEALPGIGVTIASA